MHGNAFAHNHKSEGMISITNTNTMNLRIYSMYLFLMMSKVNAYFKNQKIIIHFRYGKCGR